MPSTLGTALKRNVVMGATMMVLVLFGEAHLGQLNIALIALAVTCVLIAVTASALNAIAISQSETEPQRNNLTHGSAAKFHGSASHYGIVHVAMPKGKKAFPAELVPVD